MIASPSRHGAILRAYVMAALLALVSLFVIAPHAEAHARHHRHHHHHHHHVIRWHRARHHRARAAINTRTGAIEPVRAPFVVLGSLFQPPAASAEYGIKHGIAAIGNGTRTALAVGPAVASYVSRQVHEAGYQAVARHARELGVPVPLAMSFTAQESGGNCHAHSWAGARGVLQVEPYTARKDGFDPHRLYDCDYGAVAGLTEISHLIRADGGVTCHAVSRYYGSDAYLRHFRGGCAPKALPGKSAIAQSL